MFTTVLSNLLLRTSTLIVGQSQGMSDRVLSVRYVYHFVKKIIFPIILYCRFQCQGRFRFHYFFRGIGIHGTHTRYLPTTLSVKKVISITSSLLYIAVVSYDFLFRRSFFVAETIQLFFFFLIVYLIGSFAIKHNGAEIRTN